ncbi:MAG: hypothetical protein AMJ55_02175 [Gammaproteobacteria bacterium SG8_15]|nr:MAG: hypothetical protein AMJ55_02175 [Gammaproteobacteria bacterium SG8_15]
MKTITTHMDQKIIVFCALSFLVHVVVILGAQKSVSPLPSVQVNQDRTTLQLSFIKKSITKPQAAEPDKARNAGSVVSRAATQDTKAANSNELERAPINPINSAPSKPSTKHDRDQRIRISSEFVNFLNNTGQSQAPQLLTQATQSLRDTQLRLNHQRQQIQQLQETARMISQRLTLALSEHFSYPRLAQRNGWQGMVKLGLRIEPNGQLSRIKVVSTSGFPILDQAALETLNRISTLQGVERWLGGTYFDTVLPVEYRLLGG